MNPQSENPSNDYPLCNLPVNGFTETRHGLILDRALKALTDTDIWPGATFFYVLSFRMARC